MVDEPTRIEKAVQKTERKLTIQEAQRKIIAAMAESGPLKETLEALASGDARDQLPAPFRISADRVFSSFNKRLGRTPTRGHLETAFEADWKVEPFGREFHIVMTRFDADGKTATWEEHAKHDYVLPTQILLDVLRKSGPRELEVALSSNLYNLHSQMELMESRASMQVKAIEEATKNMAKYEAEQARNRHFRGPKPSAYIYDEAKLISTNISENGDEEERVRYVETPVRAGSSRQPKRVVRKPPTRELKPNKLSCPTHNVALVYNNERGLWKCPEKGCRIIHRPPIDTDQVALGKPPIDLRIVQPDAHADPSLFLMASNNVCVDITDFISNLNLPMDVLGAIQAAKRPGAPNYVNRETVTFTITVPRTVVIGHDATPD